MTVIPYVIVFFVGVFLLVKSAELISDSLISISQKSKISEFFIGFVLLSWISSIPEISIVLNSANVIPELSVGNLIGAKVVLLGLLGGIMVVKFNGIKFNGRFSDRSMLLALSIMFLMVLITVDGVLTVLEGLILVIIYFIYVFMLAHNFKYFPEHFHIMHLKFLPLGSNVKFPKFFELFIKVILGGAGAMIASTIIVQATISLGELLNVSEALIGLIVLALGTNLTEISVLLTSNINAIPERKLVTGNIIGSAFINSMIYGLLILLSGGIALSNNDYISIVPSLVILTLILLGFLRFAWTGKMVTKFEGSILISLYISLIVTEFILIIAK